MGRRVVSDICKNVLETKKEVDLYDIFTSKSRDDYGETYEESFCDIKGWQLYADSDCGSRKNLSGMGLKKVTDSECLYVDFIDISPNRSVGENYYVITSDDFRAVEQFNIDFPELVTGNIISETSLSQVR
jgi:hypothetical protein